MPTTLNLLASLPNDLLWLIGEFADGSFAFSEEFDVRKSRRKCDECARVWVRTECLSFSGTLSYLIRWKTVPSKMVTLGPCHDCESCTLKRYQLGAGDSTLRDITPLCKSMMEDPLFQVQRSQVRVGSEYAIEWRYLLICTKRVPTIRVAQGPVYCFVK